MTGWSPRRRCCWSLVPPTADRAVWTGIFFGGLATRNPTLFFSHVGSLLLWLEDCRLLALLFQEPLRRPQEEPAVLPPATLGSHSSGKHLLAQAPALRVRRMANSQPHGHTNIRRHALATPTPICVAGAFAGTALHSSDGCKSSRPSEPQTRKNPPRLLTGIDGICRDGPPTGGGVNTPLPLCQKLGRLPGRGQRSGSHPPGTRRL